MELFNEPKNHVRVFSDVAMIATTSVAELFGMRHSNVMRAVETSKKHIADQPQNYQKAEFYKKGRWINRYYIGIDVFSVITKRTEKKDIRDNIICKMNAINYAHQKRVQMPSVKAPAMPLEQEKTASAGNIDTEKIMSRLAAIEEKLDFIIYNAIKAGAPKPTIPKTKEKPTIKVSNEPVSVAELAKVLCQSGINIGEMRLFRWLRDNQFLCAYGSEYNLPRQKYIVQGLFVIKTSRVELPTGQVVEKNTTRVTAKGQEYFINKFLYESAHNR
jgi:anti-repressor protein